MADTSRRTVSPPMLASFTTQTDGGMNGEAENIFVDENQAPLAKRNDSRRTASPSDLAHLRDMFGGPQVRRY